MRKFNSFFSIIDGLFILFVLVAVCTSIINHSSIVSSYLVILIPCYCLIRFINCMFHKTTDTLVLLLISISCIIECCLGLFQIIQSIFIDSSTFFRGSFSNSGSYGGYLSICASILFPFVRTSDKNLLKKSGICSSDFDISFITCNIQQNCNCILCHLHLLI